MDKKRIPTGEDNFKNLIENNFYYVDKTGVIEELLDKQSKVTLFPRPRRFGKSLLMSMLNNFFDIDYKETNKDLFKGLYIESSKYYNELNSYPVIYLDFKSLKKDTYEEFYDSFKDLIAKLCVQKKYVTQILEDSERKTFDLLEYKKGSLSDYQSAVSNISLWLERYYKKQVIILIDEYDAPLSNAYVRGIYEEEISLLKGVFSNALKTNTSLKFCILTGVLRLTGMSLFSDINNLIVYDVTSSAYNEYFGFTENETKELLEYYDLELTNDVKNYYDGYNMGGISIYNPWSILNYAQLKILEAYWVNTSASSVLKTALKGLKTVDKVRLEKLILGENITFSYDKTLTYQDLNETGNANKVFSLLLATGYLTLVEKIDNFTSVYKIPNLEVKEEFIKVLKDISEVDIGNYLIDIREYLINDNKEQVENIINDSLGSISYYDSKEMFYHGYLLGLFSAFLTSDYIVKSNREAGSGRFDMMIEKVDRSVGIIIEIKVSDSKDAMEEYACIAKNQMQEKEYYQELILDKIANIKEYALVFYGKECIVR